MSGWRFRRTVGTFLAALSPFAIVAFATLSINPAAWDIFLRGFALTASIFAAGMTFTYPGWKWDA